MAIQENYRVGPWDNSVYIIFDPASREAAIVDPGMESDALWDKVIAANNFTLKYILNTHGHMDHCFNNAFFAEKSGAGVWIHQMDMGLLENLGKGGSASGMQAKPSPEPAGYLKEGTAITLGKDTSILVRHTPGHTPGSVSFLIEGGALVGDTLFRGSIGRFDGQGASGRQLVAGVRTKLFVLPDETKVYPGHGPATTIGQEKQYNPFFQPGAEQYLTH